jgi:hypothetical protein
MGFSISKDIVEKPYEKEEKFLGTFHMEDRFDPKTGAKIKSERVWDKKPKTTRWYEFDGEKYSDLDPEQWGDLLGKKFDCYVREYGCYMTGELNYVFHVNAPISYKDARSEGKITFYNESVSCEEVAALLPKALLLKSKLEDAGYNPDSPRIFIAERIS